MHSNPRLWRKNTFNNAKVTEVVLNYILVGSPCTVGIPLVIQWRFFSDYLIYARNTTTYN